MPVPPQRARSSDITVLLIAWRAGDVAAFDRLVEALYTELHRMGRYYMAKERLGIACNQPLVNEAYVNLIDAQHVHWQSRDHFLSVAARQVRRVLVHMARAKGSQKRGGAAVRVTFDEALPAVLEPGRDLVALDDALEALAAVDERKSRVVEMRFFGGPSVEQSANVLGVSVETVMRDWKVAKAWLLRELKKSSSHTSP